MKGSGTQHNSPRPYFGRQTTHSVQSPAGPAPTAQEHPNPIPAVWRDGDAGEGTQLLWRQFVPALSWHCNILLMGFKSVVVVGSMAPSKPGAPSA